MTLYPGSWQLDPMKYCSKASEEQARLAWESGDWIGQEKIDGALYQLERTDDGELYLFSRSKSKKTGELAEKLDNFPQIRSFGEHLPLGTIVVGEVYVPHGKSNDVTRLTGCLPEKAIARQFDGDKADVYLGPAHYYIFDVIRYAGEMLIDEPTIKRIKYLEDIDNAIQESSESVIETAEVFYDNFEEHLQKVFAAGGEGMVFKHKQCPYRIGKRSTVKQAFKWKTHLDSVDLVCMQLLDPVMEYTGKELETWPYWMERGECTSDNTFDWILCGENCYKDSLSNPHIFKPITKPYFYGWKIGMQLGAYKDGELVEVCKVASGLTDEMRQDMAENPANYLGRVVEIECMSVNQKDGTVRHPVFRQMRDDKDSTDCKWEDIFN